MPDDGSPMIGCDVCDDWYHWWEQRFNFCWANLCFCLQLLCGAKYFYLSPTMSVLLLPFSRSQCNFLAAPISHQQPYHWAAAHLIVGKWKFDSIMTSMRDEKSLVSNQPENRIQTVSSYLQKSTSNCSILPHQAVCTGFIRCKPAASAFSGI